MWFVHGLLFGAGGALGAMLVMSLMFGKGRDSTDDTESKSCSGMFLMKDHGTGQEYLMSIFGHLIPRGSPMEKIDIS